jgi:transposase
MARPTMRFLPVTSPEQQAALALHRTRDLLAKERTQLVNMIRDLLAEFMIGIPRGIERALAIGGGSLQARSSTCLTKRPRRSRFCAARYLRPVSDSARSIGRC